MHDPDAVGIIESQAKKSPINPRMEITSGTFEPIRTACRSCPIETGCHTGRNEQNRPVGMHALACEFISTTHARQGKTTTERLICNRGIRETVAQDNGSASKGGLDHLRHQLSSSRFIHQQLALVAQFIIIGIQDKGTQRLTDGSTARLSKENNFIAMSGKRLPENTDMRRLSCTFSAFKGNEDARTYVA